MTALELFNELQRRKAKGTMLGQPNDISSCFVTTSGGHTMRRSIGAAADIISRGGHLSDYAEIAPLYGFAGLPPWMEAENASAR
jgi:hypothetical protein